MSNCLEEMIELAEVLTEDSLLLCLLIITCMCICQCVSRNIYCRAFLTNFSNGNGIGNVQNTRIKRKPNRTRR